MSEVKYEAIQVQVDQLLTLGINFVITSSSKLMQAKQLTDIEFKAKYVENRMAKLRLACTPAPPPEDLQNQIHSSLRGITTRMNHLHGIPSTVADLLTDEVDNSLLTIGDYLDIPVFPTFGLKTHQRLIKQLEGYSDLLDYFKIPPAPKLAIRDEEDEDKDEEEELYYPSSVEDITDFDGYSLASFAGHHTTFNDRRQLATDTTPPLQ
jgi:hypothetical protein